MTQPRLDAVFWDYPQFRDESTLRSALGDARGTPSFSWFLARFLEHARAVDALAFFSLDDIAASLGAMQISQEARRKWVRLLEVHGRTART
jgi:hypothetical protein